MFVLCLCFAHWIGLLLLLLLIAVALVWPIIFRTFGFGKGRGNRQRSKPFWCGTQNSNETMSNSFFYATVWLELKSNKWMPIKKSIAFWYGRKNWIFSRVESLSQLTPNSWNWLKKAWQIVHRTTHRSMSVSVYGCFERISFLLKFIYWTPKNHKPT